MPELLRVLKKIFVESKVDNLAKDCATVFNSKAIDASSEDYSTGSTYFIRASDKPRTGLEKLAQEIFKRHTSSLEFDPTKSGAEWWSQVIHPEDDIGVHWDRDYGLEEKFGQHVYPYVGTVTYVSNLGAPTVVFQKEGTSHAKESIDGDINVMAVSCPVVGNHIAFDGKMLHAAPADIYPAAENDDEEDESEGEDDDLVSATNLSQLLEKLDTRRISFLVNIWVNHIPSQSKKCPQKVINKLNTSLEDQDINLSTNYILPKPVPVKEDEIVRSIELAFNNSSTNYLLDIPLPNSEVLDACKSTGEPFFLSFPSEATASIRQSEDQDSSSDEDSESGSAEEGEEDSNSNEEDDEDEEDDNSESEAVIYAQPCGTKRKGSNGASSNNKRQK